MCLLLWCSLFLFASFECCFTIFINSMLSLLFHKKLNAALLRSYSTVVRATVKTNVDPSYISREFIDRVQLYRQQAKRSLVIEDRTRDQCVWVQSDEYINKYLLDDSSIGLHRWRAGKLRFVLAEFEQEESFWHAIQCKFVFLGKENIF